MAVLAPDVRISIKNILVATDFSKASERALAYSKALAKHCHAKITVFHAFSLDGYYPMLPAAERTSDARKLVESELAVLVADCERKHIPHEECAMEGPLIPSLVELIDAKHIDMVVVGTHGAEGLERLLLGSMAEQIIRTVTCPVLTVGAQAILPEADELELRHILHATDLSPHALHAVPVAVSLCREFGATLTLVYILPPDVVSSRDRQKIGNFFQGQLRSLAGLYDKGVESSVFVGIGEAAGEIVDQARIQRADLIVLGVCAEGPFAGHLYRGKLFEIALTAPCPVLTVLG